MPFELQIAIRYLRSKRKNRFISLITYISITGVVIGVAALIIILSVMNGFESDVRARFINLDGHVTVRRYHYEGITTFGAVMNQIKGSKEIVSLTPYIHDKGYIISAEEATGVLIRGIDIGSAAAVTDINTNLISGRFDLGKLEDERPAYGIVLGNELAKKLRVQIDDEVKVASLAGVTSITQMPQMLRFKVKGILKTGLFEIDENFAFVSIESAQKLFNMPGQVSGIKIKIKNYQQAEVVAEDIENKLGYPFRAISWKTSNQNLYAWIQIQKWAGFIMLSLIVLVAAFNIISTLIMVSMEKTRDIGILKSMGATSKNIRTIFTIEGLVVGVFGTAIGCLIGYLLCWAQMKYKFFALPGDVYIISWLPILMKGSDFLLIAVTAVLLAFLATLYPAHKSASLDPVTAIRYE